MTDAEIEQEIITLTKDLLLPIRTKELLDRMWNLEQIDDVSEIMELLTI